MGRPRNPNPRAEPKGARWREARAACFAMWGSTCHLCGHPGAGEADHIVFTDDPALYFNPEILRPAHGHRSRCPVCKLACNQRKGGVQRQLAYANGTTARAKVMAQTIPAKPLKPPEPPPLTVAQIDAEMARMGQHWEGCHCRERIADGWHSSRCW
jgi:hypothetical protein